MESLVAGLILRLSFYLLVILRPVCAWAVFWGLISYLFMVCENFRII